LVPLFNLGGATRCHWSAGGASCGRYRFPGGAVNPSLGARMKHPCFIRSWEAISATTRLALKHRPLQGAQTSAVPRPKIDRTCRFERLRGATALSKPGRGAFSGSVCGREKVRPQSGREAGLGHAAHPSLQGCIHGVSRERVPATGCAPKLNKDNSLRTSLKNPEPAYAPGLNRVGAP
jgi:hypothetical protein